MMMQRNYLRQQSIRILFAIAIAVLYFLLIEFVITRRYPWMGTFQVFSLGVLMLCFWPFLKKHNLLIRLLFGAVIGCTAAWITEVMYTVYWGGVERLFAYLSRGVLVLFLSPYQIISLAWLFGAILAAVLPGKCGVELPPDKKDCTL